MVYHCQFCPSSFYWEDKLFEHEDDFHPICGPCNKQFSSQWGLTQHYVQSPRHVYCQKCRRLFPDWSALYSHYDEQHYYCSVCGSVCQLRCERPCSDITHLNPLSRSSNLKSAFTSTAVRNTPTCTVFRANACSRTRTTSTAIAAQPFTRGGPSNAPCKAARGRSSLPLRSSSTSSPAHAFPA